MPHHVPTGAVGRRRRSSFVLAVGAAGAALLVSGCASEGAAAAEDAVAGFQQALVSDPGEACDLLAPATLQELEKTAKTACPAAIGAAELPAGGELQRTDVAGHSARVVLDGDTIFLALFDDGWRITAAGCSPQYDDSLPYDCKVKGA